MVSGFFTIPLPASPPATGRKRSNLPFPREGLRAFIGGPSQTLLRAAMEQFEEAVPRYSPLVIHGAVGTGKSLLALGLAARWQQAHAERSCEYYTGADFARAHAYAVQADALADWRDRIAACGLVVIDGLEEMLEKPAAQQELALLADEAADRRALLLVTCRTWPLDPRLDSRLAGRLAAGLLLPLNPPDEVARREIVQRLAAAARLPLTPAALEVVCEKVAGPVPRLRAVVQQLALTRDESPTAAPLDAPEVERFLRGFAAADRPSLKQVAAAAAQVFQTRPAELAGSSRRQSVVRARGVAMWVARQVTGESYSAIGRQFGNRDHTTVMHACRKTESLLASDLEIRQAVERLLERLGQAASADSQSAGSQPAGSDSRGGAAGMNFDVLLPPVPG